MIWEAATDEEVPGNPIRLDLTPSIVFILSADEKVLGNPTGRADSRADSCPDSRIDAQTDARTDSGPDSRTDCRTNAQTDYRADSSHPNQLRS
jgi:hypothetical protein